MERDAIDFGTMKVSKLFRKIFFPTLMGMLSMSAVTAIDGIFVGHGVGSDGIAAINICIPLWMLFTGLGLMLGAGCSVVASIHLSKKKYKVARLNVTQALLFVTLVTVFLSLLILCYPEQTAYLLGSSDELLPMVTEYLVWFVPFLVFQMWGFISLFIIRLDGAPRLAMWCTLITAIINIILDWIFIFPLNWGVMGAAFATSISLAVGAFVEMIYLLFYARYFRLHPIKMSRKSLLLSLRNIGYQCRIGSSSFLGEATLAMLMFMGNQVFMHYLGIDGVGAFGIACYYLPFVFMFGNSIAQSAQPILSYNFGVKNFARVTSTAKISFYTAIFCGLIVTVVFVFFPRYLIELFLDPNTPAAQIAIEGFPYFATGFIFFILNLAVVGYYQSLERTKPATGFALLRGFIFLVPSFLCMPQLLGISGIWLAMPVSELLTLIAILGYSQVNKCKAMK